MDEIINTEEKVHDVVLTTKSGKKFPTPAKTTYTYYKSGRKDCNIEIQKPIELFGDNKEDK